MTADGLKEGSLKGFQRTYLSKMISLYWDGFWGLLKCIGTTCVVVSDNKVKLNGPCYVILGMSSPV